MRYSQFILISPMRRPAQALLALLRFDPSERLLRQRLPTSTNVKSARCYHKKTQRGPVPVMHTETQTQAYSHSSWSAYAIPGGVMGFAGLAAFVHYNAEIERRPILKGTSETKMVHMYNTEDLAQAIFKELKGSPT